MAEPAFVLDKEGLLAIFREVAGRRFVGPVDGGECVELVFDDEDGKGGNLISIFTEGRSQGEVAHGFLHQMMIEAGYGDAEA